MASDGGGRGEATLNNVDTRLLWAGTVDGNGNSAEGTANGVEPVIGSNKKLYILLPSNRFVILKQQYHYIQSAFFIPSRKIQPSYMVVIDYKRNSLLLH